MLFACALLCAGIALGSWMLERAGFDPARSAAAGLIVVTNDGIRNEIATPIGNSTAALLNQPPEVVRQQVDANLLVDDPTDPLPDATGELVGDAHAHLLGQSDAPVEITAELMSLAVRHQIVGDLPAVEIEVPRVGIMRTVDGILGVLTPIALVATASLLVVGLIAHDARAALLRSAAFGLMFIAVMMVVFGWLIPAYALPLLDDSPWADIPRQLANDDRWWIIILAGGLVAVGVMILVSIAAAGRRRRWSTPINTARYSEQQRWS